MNLHGEKTLDFLLNRRSVTAKTMTDRSPSPQQLEAMLTAAVRVPDHGKIAPWNLVVIQGDARAEFGEQVLRPAFARVNPDAQPSTVDIEAAKFTRAGVVVAVLSTPKDVAKIPVWEMHLSAGAVCATLLYAAQSAGFAAQWLTEWMAFDDAVLSALGGQPGRDQIAGFIYIGGQREEPTERPRPALEDVVTRWGEG